MWLCVLVQPDRRVYAALIRGFGIAGDASSALRTFQDMRTRFTPDVACLQSFLDACKRNSTDLRKARCATPRPSPLALCPLPVPSYFCHCISQIVGNSSLIFNKQCLIISDVLVPICSLMLDELLDEGFDLEVYSNDLLMQAFPDAPTLGRALARMEEQPVPADCEVSFTVPRGVE
jgi:pentatricopeptide repeat protein